MCDGCVMRGCQLCLVKAKSSSLSSPSPSMWGSRGRSGKQGRNSQTFLCDHPPPTPGGFTWVNFCWVCTAGLSEPLPHNSLFCGHNCYRPHLSHFGKKVIFTTPFFCLCIYVIINNE